MNCKMATLTAGGQSGIRRQRRAVEDLIFEEERGDARLLSQGYIIVRKRDLD